MHILKQIHGAKRRRVLFALLTLALIAGYDYKFVTVRMNMIDY